MPKRASVPSGSTFSRDVAVPPGSRLQGRQRLEIVPCRREAVHAAGELDRCVIDEDTRQCRRRIVEAGDLDTDLPRAGDLQHGAVGAAFQLLEDDLVGGGRIGLDDALMNLPTKILHVGVRAARERRLPRHRRFGTRQRVGARIERLDAQAIGGLGHQLLVEVAALQCLVDELAPLLVGGGCEVGSERGRVGHVAKVRFRRCKASHSIGISYADAHAESEPAPTPRRFGAPANACFGGETPFSTSAMQPMFARGILPCHERTAV